MPAKLNFKHISIVLVGTRYPENIGAAARAMLNMGLKQLILVGPENYDLARINKMATHAASAVVEKLKVYDTLKEALAGFNYVVGTTARLGGQRKVVSSPAKLAEKLIPISDQNRIAILFGPEDRGLTNVDLRSCNILVNIPTAEFSSLNLAQAVMIMCYELFRFSLDKPGEFAPRLANLAAQSQRGTDNPGHLSPGGLVREEMLPGRIEREGRGLGRLIWPIRVLVMNSLHFMKKLFYHESTK